MANIMLDEKRTVGVGEVCAINLKNIHPVNLQLLDEDDLGNGEIIKINFSKKQPL